MVIPPRVSVVEVDSAVVDPGIYESIPGETVYDLIRHAGGEEAAADKPQIEPVEAPPGEAVIEGELEEQIETVAEGEPAARPLQYFGYE